MRKLSINCQKIWDNLVIIFKRIESEILKMFRSYFTTGAVQPSAARYLGSSVEIWISGFEKTISEFWRNNEKNMDFTNLKEKMKK